MSSPDSWYRLRVFVAAGAIIAAGACSDSPVEQQTRPVPRFSANSSNAPALHSNSVHYREQTTAHATGRSGSASMTARALLGKDGQTLVELTTGQLDVAGAPGSISKVQLKFFHPSSTTMAERALNYNNLSGGGTWSHSYDEHVRMQPVQAQANIRGIDPKRTDVVTVTETIKLRPDVAVLAVNAPPRVTVGTMVSILSTIAEQNGDVGATTNCVLYIDGVEADRADGVWVANGDEITCAFAHKFDTQGTFTLTVAAESVVPGDWDTANNSKSATIEVTNPILHGYAYASDYQYDYSYRDYGYNYANSYWSYWFQGWDYAQESHGRSQYAYFYGYTPSQWASPYGVVASLKTNGYAFDGRWAANFTNPGNPCAYQWSPGFNLLACTYPWGSTVTAERWASWSYYWSRQSYNSYYCNYYYGCSSSGYYYSTGPYFNSNGTWVANLGNDVSWHVEVYPAGGGTFTGDATVPLVTWSQYEYNQPFTCYSNWYYYGYSCFGSSYRDRYRSGSVNF